MLAKNLNWVRGRRDHLLPYACFFFFPKLFFKYRSTFYAELSLLFSALTLELTELGYRSLMVVHWMESYDI